MLKILTRVAQTKVKAKLSIPFMQGLQLVYEKAVKGVDAEETRQNHREYTFTAFFADLINSVDYRATAGKDGNWDEMEMNGITDSHYELILRTMRGCGYTTELEKW